MIDSVDCGWVREILACPCCRESLLGDNGAAFRCPACGDTYASVLGRGTPDLRPRREVSRSMTLRTGRTDYAALWASTLKAPPSLTFHGHSVTRTSPHFLSVIQERLPPGALVLDLGCGAGEHGPLIKGMGRRYLGLDYGNPGADLLADAHALPVRDAVADAVMMHALSQALENPFVGFAEAVRVLKPGGWLLGTADSGATFDGSFFNMTPWGVLSVLCSQGMTVERMWLTKDALLYLGTNSGYPRAIRFLLRGLSRAAKASWLTPRRALSGTPRDDFMTAGSFAFVAQKPAVPGS